MLFRNIMVPYDGSKLARHAFKVALEMAGTHRSKITVVTCIGKYYSGSWYVDSRIADQDFKRQYKAAKAEHLELEKMAEESGIQFGSKIIQESKTAKGLSDYAKEQKIDLIAMGSHGRTGWSKMILGSVASGVLQTVKCPVLIVR